jgi:hypothetical protein
MNVELIFNDFLDPVNVPDLIPSSILSYIDSLIIKRDRDIEEEEDGSDSDKEYMKLKISDFRVIVWIIDKITYYDVCQFKDDAEVGAIIKIDNDIAVRMCEIDEAVLLPLEPNKKNKLWCKNFEKERIKILKL